MQESYGESRIYEIHVTKEEVGAIVCENIIARTDGGSYDFDRFHPIIITLPDGGFIFRFVQQHIVRDVPLRSVSLMKMPKESP